MIAEKGQGLNFDSNDDGSGDCSFAQISYGNGTPLLLRLVEPKRLKESGDAVGLKGIWDEDSFKYHMRNRQ